MAPVIVWAPPAKLRVPGPVTAPPIVLCGPLNASVPVWMAIVPVLVKLTPMSVVPAVTVFSSVPALVNAVVPLCLTTLASVAISNVALASFWIVAPTEPKPEGFRPSSKLPADQVKVPWFSRVRPPSR